jgi:serine/threonine protein kinase
MADSRWRAFPPRYRVASRYRMEHALGHGGMAAVYAAWDQHLQRRVALKFLLAAHAADPRLVERFAREARAAASIRHPGVVEIYDAGTDAGSFYLVMQLLQGESLQARIERQLKQPLRFVVRVGMELCSALTAAHDRGIVHRDLKPSNLFLVRSVDQDELKVLDFGIAKLRDDARLTISGEVFGTLAYMAPELLRDTASAVPASDLHSVGAILFEMVTGRRPFEGVAPGPLAIAILTDPPRSIGQFRSDVPHALASLIERALRKNPEERFASAAEMGSALDLIARELPEEGLVAPPPRSDATGLSIEPTQPLGMPG